MWGLLKTHSDALNVVANSYADPGRKLAPHADEQEPWSGLDPVRLIDLLENIDGLKQEVQDRMRRIEAVNQAKSLLQEDAIRTEALNRKLAELGKAFGEVRHESHVGETRNREADLLRMPPRELVSEIPSRPIERPPSTPESADWHPFENREMTVQSDFAVRPSTIQTVPQEPVARPANSLRFDADVHPAEEMRMAEHEPATAVESVQQPNDAAESAEAYRKFAQQFSDMSQQRDEAIQSALEAKNSYDDARQLLEDCRRICDEAKESLHGTKLHLEQAAAQLSVSRGKEEAATADLRSAQQDLTTAYQFAAVAAQRQHDAAEFFRKSNRWNIFAVAFSWIVITWMAWLQFRTLIPIWGPGAASIVILGLAVLVSNLGSKRE